MPLWLRQWLADFAQIAQKTKRAIIIIDSLESAGLRDFRPQPCVFMIIAAITTNSHWSDAQFEFRIKGFSADPDSVPSFCPLLAEQSQDP
jgi:hypothetical protein